MSTLPWRLPPPPGMAARATSLPKVSAAPLSNEEEPTTFSFQRRYHKLNWKDILQVDLGNIIQQVDLQTLHQQLEPITFADIGPDDVEYFTDNNFLHLFRLCQLLLEYQLFAWRATTISANLRDSKYEQLKASALKIKDTLVKTVNENKSLKKELQYCKKMISVMEERERNSLYHAAHMQYPQAALSVGSVSRHPHQPFHPHQHQPFSHTMHHPYHPHSRKHADDEKENTNTANTPAPSPADRLKASLEKENEKRNAKIENLEASLHLLLQAQQAEMKKQREAAVTVPTTGDENADESVAVSPVTPLESQLAQQKLINNILQELTSLKDTIATSEQIAISAVETAAPSPHPPPPGAPHPTPASTQHHTFPMHPKASPMALTINPTASPINMSLTPQAVQPTPTGIPTVPVNQTGLRASARAPPTYTKEQQAELDHLSQWLKNVEADEVGAEIMKIQLESALVNQAESIKKLKELEAKEEEEVRRIEASLPPDHPLLQDTVLARVAKDQEKERTQYPPVNLTVELQSPASLPIAADNPQLVGHTVIMPPPFSSKFQKALPSTRDPVVPVAPLADATPLPTREEKLDHLLTLSPTSRIRAMEAEKIAIKLRAVIQARSSVEKSLYTPFPSMPFLGSMYNHSPEELREHYDLVYLWMDTSMRSEEGAQELLRYAVQMDCTGEIYEEMAKKVENEYTKYYVPPEEYIAEVRRIEELERLNEVHRQEEQERQLREARWQDERIRNFEQQWIALQEDKDEAEYYAEELEKVKLHHQEQEFQAYLAKLEAKSKADKAAREAHQAKQDEYVIGGPLYFPPDSTSTNFASSPRSSPTKKEQLALEPKSTNEMEATKATTAETDSAAVPAAGLSRVYGIRKNPALPQKRRKPAVRLNRKLGEADDDEDDEEEEEEEAEEEPAETAPLSSKKPSDTLQQRSSPQKKQKETTSQPEGSQGPDSVVAIAQTQEGVADDEFGDRISPVKSKPGTADPALTQQQRQTQIEAERAAATIGSVRLTSPHAPRTASATSNAFAPANPSAAIKAAGSTTEQKADLSRPTSRTAAAAQAIAAAAPHDDVDDDDDVGEEEDDDAAARQRISRMASGSFEPVASNQFSRPQTRGKGLLSEQRSAAEVNQTPEKALSLAQQQLAGIRPSTATSLGTSSNFGGNARPKTSVGSSRPRFLTGEDSFDQEDDEEESRPLGLNEDDEPVQGGGGNLAPRTPVIDHNAATTFGGPLAGPRILGSKRQVPINLSAANKPVAAGGYQPAAASAVARNANVASSRPIGMLVNDTQFSDSDGNVSDVSSIVNLNEEDHRASTAPMPEISTLPVSQPILTTSSSSIIQTGKGRPRGAPSKLSSLSNPSFQPPPEEDSLSSLLGAGGGLGGGMKRPGGRGLSSQTGGYKSKLMSVVKPDSDNDSSLDLDY